MSSPGPIGTTRARSALIWAWPVLLTLVGSLLVIVDVAGGRMSVGEAVPGFVMALVFTYLGALIAVRQAGNRVAFLLFTIGLGLFITGALAPEAESESILTWLGLVLENWVGLSLIFYPLVLIAYLFPTGRFFTARQVWIGRLGTAAVALNLLVAVFVDEIGPAFSSEQDYWSVANPLGFLPSEVLDVTVTAWGQILVLMAFGGVWSLVNRYRRSSAEVRAQIRWMLLASFLVGVGFVLIVTSDTDNNLAGFVVSLTFVSVPVAITIAITRFRLYEIDRIISRTISYVIIVALLGAVYLGGVAVFTSLLATENSLAVAASTLAVAALFNPLRRRIQGIVDRKFNRSTYDHQQLIDRLSRRLRAEAQTEPRQIQQELVKAVVRALEPASIGVWVASENEDEGHVMSRTGE